MDLGQAESPMPEVKRCAHCGRKETQNHKLISHDDQWWCPGACIIKVGTGRLRCSEPAIQNIPIRTELGRKIREALFPNPRLQGDKGSE